MPTMLAAPADAPYPGTFRLSVERYEQMVDAGILGENDRVELIDGELRDKMPIGDPHAWCVMVLTKRFSQALEDRAEINVQNPLRLAASVPEPDLTLLRPPLAQYRRRKPAPADVLLLVEVADTSLHYDLRVKGPLYAAAGIAEYWAIDLPGACVHVHGGPHADGTWETVEIRRPGDALAPAAFPDCGLDLAALLA